MADKKLIDTEAPQPNPSVVGMSEEQFARFIAATQGPTKEERIEELRLAAKFNQEADRGSRIPEVVGLGEMKSVYNPHGDSNDLVHHPDSKPRSRLLPAYPMFCFGDIVTELGTYTYDEIELLVKLNKNGQYKIEKSDGTMHILEVKIERDSDGKPTRMLLGSVSSLKASGKTGLPKMVTYLREIVRQQNARETVNA